MKATPHLIISARVGTTFKEKRPEMNGMLRCTFTCTFCGRRHQVTQHFVQDQIVLFAMQIYIDPNLLPCKN